MALRIVPRRTSRLLPSRPVRRAAALRSSFTKQTTRLRMTADGLSSGGLTAATLAFIRLFLGLVAVQTHHCGLGGDFLRRIAVEQERPPYRLS